jgi:hypothetical protein
MLPQFPAGQHRKLSLQPQEVWLLRSNGRVCERAGAERAMDELEHDDAKL